MCSRFLSTLRFCGCRQPSKRFFAINQLYSSALQVVVTPIERCTDKIHFVDQPDHGILNEFFTWATGIPRHLLQFGLHIGLEMDFHMDLLSA